MAYFAGYPGVSGEDLERIDAMASYKPPLAFEDVFAVLDPETNRENAEKAYNDFLADAQPPAGYKPPEVAAEDELSAD